MNAALHALPRRSPLLPGESLPSLLARLTQLNYYDEPGTLGWIVRTHGPTQGERDNTARSKQPETYAALAALTGILVSDLFTASDHFFAPIVTPPDEPMDSITLPNGETWPVAALVTFQKRIRPPRAAQYCPECLKEAAYHRQAWSPVACALCLRHARLLVNECPQCTRRLTVTEIVACKCYTCETDLREAPAPALSPDALGLASQQAIQQWLGVAPKPEMPPGYDLPDEPPGALFRVLDGLRLSLIHGQPDWPQLQPPLAGLHEAIQVELGQKEVMPPYCAYHLYRAAFTGLLRWPIGFYEFLDAFSQRNARTKNSVGPQGRMGTLFNRWVSISWRHSDFAFLQQAFRDYVLSGRFPLFYFMRAKLFEGDTTLATQFGFLNKTETAQILGISDRLFDRLVKKTKTLVPFAWAGGGKHHFAIMERSKVLELKQQWDTGLTLEETCRSLGLSTSLVRELAKRNVLAVERGPQHDETSHWLFNSESVARFSESVWRNLTSAYVQPDTNSIGKRQDLLTTREACKRVAVVGLNGADLLLRVAEGTLAACYYMEDGAMSAIGYPISAIEALPQIIRIERGWLMLDDIAQRMGVKPVVVSKWVNDGVIVPVAKHAGAWYFEQSQVEQFVQEHIFSEEAAQILGIGELAVQKWARTGRLKPLAGLRVNGCRRYLFRREDVERLRAEYRLTAPQMAKRLGISRAQLHVWIKQGKVKPVSGPGVDQCKQYLFVV